MPQLTPHLFFTRKTYHPNDIRYAILPRNTTCGNFFSNKPCFNGYLLSGAMIYRSLKDAYEGLELGSGLIIQFVVNEVDSVLKITHQYSLEDDDDKQVVSSQNTRKIIEALDEEYQKYLTNYPIHKIRYPDEIVRDTDTNKYYRFAKLSNESFGPDPLHVPHKNLIMFVASILYTPIYLALCVYHSFSDTSLFGHTLEKPIKFDNFYFWGEKNSQLECGTWIKFEVDADNQFLRLDSAYLVSDSEGYYELSLDLSNTTPTAVIEKFRDQYQTYLIELEESKVRAQLKEQRAKERYEQHEKRKSERKEERLRKINEKNRRDLAAMAPTQAPPETEPQSPSPIGIN